MKKRNEEALAQFAAAVAEIQELLEGIREAADGDFDADPDTLDWGHAGDACWTRDQLKHVLAVIHGDEGK